jgi:eukaryotic-like serine/threonine-protein kinase
VRPMGARAPIPTGRVGAVFGGRWRVDERIGSGGMATVYAVSDRKGNRAALKMLHSQLSRDPQTRARFVREGKVANSIEHPGVVRVLDDGVTDDGIAYLVLELLEGETIEARRLRLGGKLPIEEVLDTADMALDALAAAHAQQIIHRDVKPENFFLCLDGNVKLLDFGLARMKDANAEATRTGVTIGTPEFMPPEQALGRRDSVDARSDVWGLGATMFNAITGEYVHDAPTLHEQLMASATKRARPIRSLAPQVPPAVAVVIDRALELEMSDRWQSAQDMQDALRRARQDSSRTLPSNDSLTFPVLSKPAGLERFAPTSEPSSSDRTREINPRKLVTGENEAVRSTEAIGPLDSGPLFGERTLAMDPTSKLPVSPIPSTERMNADRMSPGMLPNAPPLVFGGTLPSFTPSSVRAVQPGPGAPAFMQAHSLGNAHGAGPISRSNPQTANTGNVAPTLRSSARGIVIFAIVFVVSIVVLGTLAWRFLLT